MSERCVPPLSAPSPPPSLSVLCPQPFQYQHMVSAAAREMRRLQADGRMLEMLKLMLLCAVAIQVGGALMQSPPHGTYSLTIASVFLAPREALAFATHTPLLLPPLTALPSSRPSS